MLTSSLWSRRSPVNELGPVAISTTAAAAAEHKYIHTERERKRERGQREMRNKTIGIIITKSLDNKITEQSKRNHKIGKSKSSKSISNFKN